MKTMAAAAAMPLAALPRKEVKALPSFARMAAAAAMTQTVLQSFDAQRGLGGDSRPPPLRVESPSLSTMRRLLAPTDELHSSVMIELERGDGARARLGSLLAALPASEREQAGAELRDLTLRLEAAGGACTELRQSAATDKSTMEKLRSLLLMEREQSKRMLRNQTISLSGGSGDGGDSDGLRLQLARELDASRVENARLRKELAESCVENARLRAGFSRPLGAVKRDKHGPAAVLLKAQLAVPSPDSAEELYTAQRAAKTARLEASNLSEMIIQLQRVLEGHEKEIKVAEHVMPPPRSHPAAPLL